MRGDEMYSPALVSHDPPADGRRFVGGIVVQDHMNFQACGRLVVDLL